MSNAKRGVRLGLLVLTVAVVATVAGALVLGPTLGAGEGQATTSNDAQSASSAADARPTEVISQGSLTESKEAGGTVSYGDSWPAPFEASGVVTKRHPQGTIVQPGEPLIWLGTRPIFLAAGDVPVYREMFYGRDRDKELQSGDDVRQLQEFLLEQGFNDKKRLTVDGEFGPNTQRAVKAWQKENGLPETGRVDRSQLVFHPRAVRIDNEPMIGSQFTELLVGNDAQTITASFDDRSRSFLPVGGSVDLAVDGGSSITGTINKVESATLADGSRGFNVEITPDEPLDSSVERVEITATKTLVTNALLIPARAIVALAGNGYAVEVRTEAGVELRRIELGSFVDDMVEITGDVTEGLEVVVPGDGIGGGQ